MTQQQTNNAIPQNLRDIDVHELLPQQEPFVMIGSLVSIDNVRTVTETVVRDGNLFVDNGTMNACGLMENIAQTCAARMGFANRYNGDGTVQIGFIGAVKNLDVKELPRVGDVLTTTVDVRAEVMGMTLVGATVTSGDRLLATAEMKIAMKED